MDEELAEQYIKAMLSVKSGYAPIRMEDTMQPTPDNSAQEQREYEERLHENAEKLLEACEAAYVDIVRRAFLDDERARRLRGQLYSVITAVRGDNY